jgi:hypothetical protein
MELKVDQRDGEIKRAIVGAIAFFDMFDYPLTPIEIWKFAKVRQGTPRKIIEILESGNLNNIIEDKNGFYFLKGRSEIIKTRLGRYIHTDRKFKRALRVVKIFKFIPWIKMIAVSNVIGAHNLKDGSDIDLFIITKSKKIWLTRFFCISIAQLLGLRPKKGNERDKVCLNFYITDEFMDIKNMMLDDNDVYFKYWLVNLIPIYEIDNAYKKFIQKNSWIKDCFPNWLPVQMERRRYFRNNYSRFNLLNLFNGFENKFKKLQLKLMPKEMKKLMNKDTRVIVNDQVLKMHVNDRRGEYRDRFFNELHDLKRGD